MTIKMSMTCTRCHREDVHEIETLALATAIEELEKRKVATTAKLQAFVAALPQDELPDFFAILGGRTLVHGYLCDPEEAKRSCSKRVSDLLEGTIELGPRKPRTAKEKDAAAEVEKPEAAKKEPAVAEAK